MTTALVLVVDDEPPVRAVERRILELGGYTVVEAPGASEALALLAQDVTPDLVIADLDMPVIPGEEMVRTIHQTRPHQKVLYVTAHIDRLLEVQSIAWAGEAFLEKPFTAKALLEAVSLLLWGTLSPPAAPDSSVNPPPNPKADRHDAVRGTTVLIVDDEAAIRRLLRHWLQADGHQVVEAESAEQALEHCKRTLPDVALCDIAMPGNDGLWLVQRLREDYPDVAIALATANDHISPMVALRDGVVDYVLKPFDRARICQAVRQGVMWRSQVMLDDVSADWSSNSVPGGTAETE
jgi:CheY-like chemotaxis protein